MQFKMINKARNDAETHWPLLKAVTKGHLLKRNHTYCPMLWDSVFIDQHGNVFTCCHYQPGIVGNLYRQNLTRIWNKSVKLKMYRWMSLNKCLPCFDACTLISGSQKNGDPPSSERLVYPKRFRLLYGEYCNISCIMCHQNHRSKIMIDNETIKRNVNFSLLEDIDFQGGEVLAMKNARELYLWLTGTINKKVNLITNGVLINDEWARHIIKGSNWIQISVNAATKKTHEMVNRNSNFVRVIDNIRKLTRLRNELGTDIKIVYKFTIVPENIHEIDQAIKLANDLDCDQIAFGFDTPIPILLENNMRVKESIKHRINQLRNKNLKINIETKRLEQLDLLC